MKADLIYFGYMQKVKIGVLLIGVTSLVKARPFYEKVFGVKVLDFRPPFMLGKIGDIELNIEEDAEYRFKDWARHNIGNRKSFTFEVEDVFDFLDTAKESGAVVIEEPIKQSWGWYESVIADPDGNQFVIEQKINETN